MSTKRASRTAPAFTRTVLLREGRFDVIEAWGKARMGAPASRLGVAQTRAKLPKLGGLRYNSEASRSPAGGRIDPHLRHLEDVEALERIARAERFVSDTKSGYRAEPARAEPPDPTAPANPNSRAPSARG